VPQQLVGLPVLAVSTARCRSRRQPLPGSIDCRA